MAALPLSTVPDTVVVVGASGFVGRNLVAHLAGRVPRLIAVSPSGQSVPGATEAARFDALEALSVPADAIVVNVAAQRYDADKFETAQSDLLTGNAEIANRLYRFCLTKGIREVRAASSVAVYPAACDPLDDAQAVDLNAPPNRNEAFYAWSKRWSEVIADLHAERYGIHTISFRLSNPYGPHDSTDPRKAHVLPAFVMRALAPGERFEIKGNPLVERDFIYVGDVVDVFARSLEMRETSDALNLCRGETTTLLDLARTILEVAGEDRPVHAPDTATHGVLARRSTNRRLRERFGLSSFTGLADGLRPTIAWYREAYRGRADHAGA
ncbi:NAD(P)-dependent oxidoreductase [Methylobacterium sp. yr668]|uniref:NAD-dependent epimerase/dehydratase family protein n=1 Tax=Methylobacterium sp. yr668 TaxID=1761801 RepID=UPI0008E10A4E|nr:NAD(P)-dependent oxidoreductase [Methylobacterium sp. yr668]SFT26328.1 Nucleoside-diphosphate-sugar epimerase [Methylobacterium sp. yr668]